jgi:hypothetical protein
MTDDRLPDDLVPLPTAPYSERPVSLPLDVEECRTAIWRCRGNVSEAAGLLKVTPGRLRSFVRASPRLSAEVAEAREQLVDIAEDVAYDALTTADDPGRRESMARFVLGSLGKSRGYGSASGGNVTINNAKGPIVIGWADGSDFSQGGGEGVSRDPKTIDGEVVE